MYSANDWVDSFSAHQPCPLRREGGPVRVTPSYGCKPDIACVGWAARVRDPL